MDRMKATARQSWVSVKTSVEYQARAARAWVGDPELAQQVKDLDARRIEQVVARNKRRGTKRPAVPVEPPLTGSEVKQAVFRKRVSRGVVIGGAAGAVVVGPPLLAAGGDVAALALWPVVYGGLWAHGWWMQRGGIAEDAVEPVEGDAEETDGVDPTRDEAVILSALAGWSEAAAGRKLDGLVPGPVVIDESGLVVPFVLGGQWTLPRLLKAEDQVRALLGVPTGVDMQVKPGPDARGAVVRVRTRERELDTKWKPGVEGIGLGADTGVPIHVPLCDRLLVAGMSGAGKSVMLRVLMAAAHAQECTELVVLDLKVEGALWGHTARVESDPEEIAGAIEELVEEMRWRESVMRSRGLDHWTPTVEHPRLVVVVDEGAELLEELDDEAVTGLRSLARRARSAEMPLWWATQKPTMSGPGRGLDSAIAGQLTTRVCLAVSSEREARTVLGEGATERGWHPERLAKGGWFLCDVQGEGSVPDPGRGWFMAREDVKALPAREPWRRRKDKRLVVLPDVLIAALAECGGDAGAATGGVARRLGVSEVEVNSLMRGLGLFPEANAFAVREGVRARGYRREVLELKRAELEGN